MKRQIKSLKHAFDTNWQPSFQFEGCLFFFSVCIQGRFLRSNISHFNTTSRKKKKINFSLMCILQKKKKKQGKPAALIHVCLAFRTLGKLCVCSTVQYLV